MLTQLQGGWREIMGAPENVSYRASKITVFPETSLVPSCVCSGEICISFFLTVDLCFYLLNLCNCKEIKSNLKVTILLSTCGGADTPDDGIFDV